MAFHTTLGQSTLTLSALSFPTWEILKAVPRVGTTGWDQLNLDLAMDVGQAVAEYGVPTGVYPVQTLAEQILLDNWGKGMSYVTHTGRWIVDEVELTNIVGGIALASVRCKGIGFYREWDLPEPGSYENEPDGLRFLRYHMTGGSSVESFETITTAIDSPGYPVSPDPWGRLTVQRAVPTITVEVILHGRPETLLVGTQLPSGHLLYQPEVAPIPLIEDWDEHFIRAWRFPHGWHIVNQEWETIGRPYNSAGGSLPPAAGAWDGNEWINMLTLQKDTYAYKAQSYPANEEA